MSDPNLPNERTNPPDPVDRVDCIRGHRSDGVPEYA